MRAKLGDVEFSVVESESPQYSNEITSHPVESGQDVSDHIKQTPIKFNINGVVTGDDAAQKLETLKQYRNSGQLLQYVGRNLIKNVVIEDLSTQHNATVRNGFAFSIALHQIRIATSQTTVIQLADPVSPKPIGPVATTTQTKKVTNKGTQQPKAIQADSDRYTAMAKKYEEQQKKLNLKYAFNLDKGLSSL